MDIWNPLVRMDFGGCRVQESEHFGAKVNLLLGWILWGFWSQMDGFCGCLGSVKKVNLFWCNFFFLGGGIEVKKWTVQI